jgi:hypothetical protein
MSKKTKRQGNEITQRSSTQIDRQKEDLDRLLSTISGMGPKWDLHLLTFLSPVALARCLWLRKVYRLAQKTPGVLVEFGSQWGASMNIWLALKMIYEPWNIGREIISFSLFEEGFKDIDQKDGKSLQKGDYAVQKNWEMQLKEILLSHAANSPIGPNNNTEIIKGDVVETFPAWLETNPQAIISLAHFDLDVYLPTKEVLQKCLKRMPQGSVLVFDELNCRPFPGETIALDEVMGIPNLKLKKSKFAPYSAYCII